MKIVIPLTAIAICLSAQAHAESDLEKGFAGAIKGCAEWVLNPASWANGPEPFISAVGLGDKMGLVESVAEPSRPPPTMRVANHYWRINSTPSVGYVLVVSDRLPMCHITGGGDADLQPVIESVLGSQSFAERWERIEDSSRGDMRPTSYRSRVNASFSIVIGRAASPGQRLDHVQVLATAFFERR